VYSLHKGINDGIEAYEAGRVSPHIVSMSLSFPSWSFRNKDGQRDFLKRAPWLWVMAAGNSATDIGLERRTCFGDVPSEYRKDDAILCVGALEKGMTGDRIAHYSNFGTRVDVYAYDSYIRHCPNGTSCATPAISAAAAVIKAKFPAMTTAQLKQAIVAASVERDLEIAPRPARSPLAPASRPTGVKRRVRVFDPATMIPKALEQARLIMTSSR
jgi:subtilisin family serine protease